MLSTCSQFAFKLVTELTTGLLHDTPRRATGSLGMLNRPSKVAYWPTCLSGGMDARIHQVRIWLLAVSVQATEFFHRIDLQYADADGQSM